MLDFILKKFQFRVKKLYFFTVDAFCLQMAQREPGSDYKWKLMQYESRKRELDDRKMVELKEELLKDTIKAKYMTHTEKISFKKQVEKRVEQKLEEYDRSFEERRKK